MKRKPAPWLPGTRNHAADGILPEIEIKEKGQFFPHQP